METQLKENIEHTIDNALEETVLDNAYRMFKTALSPTVRNFEDALFGYVIGRTLEFTYQTIELIYGRDPTLEETGEVGRILQRRASEIKSKVKTIANR